MDSRFAALKTKRLELRLCALARDFGETLSVPDFNVQTVSVLKHKALLLRRAVLNSNK